jgi:hypothetical protein
MLLLVLDLSAFRVTQGGWSSLNVVRSLLAVALFPVLGKGAGFDSASSVTTNYLFAYKRLTATT